MSEALSAGMARLNDYDPAVRGEVVRALGEIGGDRAADALIAKLNDEVQWVGAAVCALGQIGGDRASEALIVKLDDEDSTVRDSAADALARIGSDRATEAFTGSGTTRLLSNRKCYFLTRFSAQSVEMAADDKTTSITPAWTSSMVPP